MSRLSRRAALAQLAAVALAPCMPRSALSATPTDRRFVLVILRGALDGLAAMPPYGDPSYRAARGALALAAPGDGDGVLDLDGFFGLHAALAPLHAFYRRGQLLMIPAVATSYRGRSHHEAEAVFEGGIGIASPQASPGGWVDRTVGLMAQATRPIPTLTKRPPLPDGSDIGAGQLDLVTDLCYGNPHFARALAESGWIGGSPPASSLDDALFLAAWQQRADAFKAAAGQMGKRLAAESGPRIAVLESFGWDTHTDQGRVEGRLAIALTGLGEGLNALATGCGGAWRETVVLVTTEFGRAVAMNDASGTDHGTASVALLLGGAVEGGRIAGTWPGLAPERLLEGRDLMPTTDLWAIVKGVLISHLGLPREALDRVVLPGSAAVEPIPELIRA